MAKGGKTLAITFTRIDSLSQLKDERQLLRRDEEEHSLGRDDHPGPDLRDHLEFEVRAARVWLLENNLAVTKSLRNAAMSSSLNKFSLKQKFMTVYADVFFSHGSRCGIDVRGPTYPQVVASNATGSWAIFPPLIFLTLLYFIFQ